MEKAIKLAIEGGWRLRGGFQATKIENLTTAHPDIKYWYRDNTTPHDYAVLVESSEIFLDPLFWQSLGKRLGWNTEDQCDFVNQKGIGMLYLDGGAEPVWLRKWHRFIDYIATGGTPDEFFTKLLPQSTSSDKE